MRTLWNAVRSQKILPGRGYRVKVTSLGTALEIDQGGGGGKATGLVFMGEYTGTPGDCAANQIWIISGAIHTGTYICMVSPATVNPWEGGTGGVVNWVQLPMDKGAWG